jgi:hypothetical protein
MNSTTLISRWSARSLPDTDERNERDRGRSLGRPRSAFGARGLELWNCCRPIPLPAPDLKNWRRYQRSWPLMGDVAAILPRGAKGSNSFPASRCRPTAILPTVTELDPGRYNPSQSSGPDHSHHTFRLPPCQPCPIEQIKDRVRAALLATDAAMRTHSSDEVCSFEISQQG